MNIEEDINILKQLIREYKRKPETQNEFFIGLIEERALENLLTAYEKQQKEIEELRANKGYHLGFIDGGIAKRYEYEDKIKAEIEELQEDIKYSANPLSIDNSKFGIKVLQSLLEKE